MSGHFKICTHLKAVIFPMCTTTVIGDMDENVFFFFFLRNNTEPPASTIMLGFLESKPAELTLIITRALHPKA